MAFILKVIVRGVKLKLMTLLEFCILLLIIGVLTLVTLGVMFLEARAADAVTIVSTQTDWVAIIAQVGTSVGGLMLIFYQIKKLTTHVNSNFTKLLRRQFEAGGAYERERATGRARPADRSKNRHSSITYGKKRIST